MSKQQLGQFYTTKADYIIGDLVYNVPTDAVLVDPFVGEWDLLNIFKNEHKIGYDIEPKTENTVYKDSLQNPIDYSGKWVITNPPYLAKNKSKDKSIYDMYGVSDLYKAALVSITTCEGGILIIPINFFSDEDNSIRTTFLSNFTITGMHIFEESVFTDTDYTVCAFSFIRTPNTVQHIKACVYPRKEVFSFTIDSDSGYRIGSEFYSTFLIKSDIKIGRMVDYRHNTLKPTHLFIKAIDTGTFSGRIRLEFRDDIFYGKPTDRAFATIGLSIDLTTDEELFIIKRFNAILNNYREKYRSLFLTNYRNSTESYSRKRIGFDTVYSLILYIIEKEMHIYER